MPKKIIASFLTDDNDFQRLQAADARQAAAREKLDIEVLFAENNPIDQIQQLFRQIHAPVEQRPAAIIVETVSGEGLERVARNALQAGISWVLINRTVTYLDELRERFPALLVCAVGVDQLAVGRLQGRQLRALLPRGGNVLYLQGPPDTSTSQERLTAVQQTIQGSGIQVQVINGRWTAESGEKAVQSWLRLKTWANARIDLVACQNDEMAVGARRALLAHPEASRQEWSRLRYIGCDGLAQGGRRLVDQGEMAATVVTPSNGGPAVELAARFLRGDGPIPAKVLQPPVSYPAEEELARRLGAPAR